RRVACVDRIRTVIAESKYDATLQFAVVLRHQQPAIFAKSINKTIKGFATHERKPGSFECFGDKAVSLVQMFRSDLDHHPGSLGGPDVLPGNSADVFPKGLFRLLQIDHVTAVGSSVRPIR